MPHVTSGSRRLVFVFKNFVVKIPKPTSWLSFILGIMENLHERYWWCGDGYTSHPEDWYSSNSSTQHLAQIHWADRFGLMVIMERVRVLRDIPEEADEFEKCADFLKQHYDGLDVVEDLKPSNIGVREDGRIVMVDYGYFQSLNSQYLGRKVFKRFPKRS